MNNKTLETAASILDVLPNIFDTISNVSTTLEKATDIGKITDVTFSPALKTVSDIMEVYSPRRMATYG